MTAVLIRIYNLLFINLAILQEPSIGFDQNLTNQTIFQSTSSNNNAVNWNWVDNTHSVNTSHSQEESQGYVLQSARNNNMFQEIPEVRRTMEATSSSQLPLDLSEIFVIPIESTNQPSEPPPLYQVSHQSHNIVPEQLSNLSISNTTAPEAIHSTAFVNPGENSERSTSQNNSNFPYLMSNSGYSSYSTPQQNSEGASIMNYNNPNNQTLTGTAFHRFQYELYRSIPSPRMYEQSSEQQNRTTGSVSHSSRLTSSHEGYTQSRIHPYYTTGQQQQRDSADIRGRRFGHNQNSATFSSSSDSPNYYQRNANQQTVDYSSIQSNITTATNLPTTYELDRPNFIRTVNNSESVSTSDSQSTSVGSRTSQATRESSFFTSSNNSLGGASVFLPFNQPKQEPKRNNRWANGMIKPLNRNTKISTAVQLSAARQFITQAASSAAASGYSEFSRSLTEILQDLEKLVNFFFFVNYILTKM